MSFIKNPVQIITQKFVSSDRHVHIDYPVVIGMTDAAVQQKMNRRIIALINKLIVAQGYYQNPGTTVQGWYEIKNNQRGILSLNIGNYAMAPMAAHGLTVIESLTFDIETGKTYTLGELFKPASDYIKVLSGMVEEQIKIREIPMLGDFPGVAPDQDYYIADKSLVIYYQLYAITPYAYGFPFFPISVYAIQDIILEDGPLGLMAINN